MTPPARRCPAHSKVTRDPCRYPPAEGATVCRWHGGNAPQVRAAAQRRVAEAKAQKVMAEELLKLNIQPLGDPLTALQQLGGEILAWKNLAAARVAKLRDMGYSNEYGEQIKAEVVIFERAMDRCAAVLASIARLNIDDRLAAIDGAKKLMIIRAIEAGLASQGIVGP